MQEHTENHTSRRYFLKATTAGAIGMALGTRLTHAAEEDPYGGFKMGIQSYSLRGFDVKTAIKHSQKLGLHYWEAYPAHVPMGTVPKHIADQKALFEGTDIKLTAYGVLGFDEDETKARQAFDFAKAMGIVSLSANPRKTKGTFDLLDKLCEEYGVAIAIHNHGPGALYDKIDDVIAITKDRHPLVGACVDTGHYIRSDEDPVEAIEKIGKRVFGIHLKDVRTIEVDGNRRKQFTILGQGDLDVPGCLKAARKFGYENCLSLEYEENPDNPLSDIEVCLQTVREAVKKLKV